LDYDGGLIANPNIEHDPSIYAALAFVFSVIGIFLLTFFVINISFGWSLLITLIGSITCGVFGYKAGVKIEETNKIYSVNEKKLRDNQPKKEITHQIYDFASIDDCEIIEDGETIETIKKDGSGTAAAAYLFGMPLGAIAASNMADSTVTSKSFINHLSIRIQLKDGTGSTGYTFIDEQTTKTSEEYEDAIEHAKNEVSTTEQLRKYKSLLDDGVITQEEFDAKKKQLLGL